MGKLTLVAAMPASIYLLPLKGLVAATHGPLQQS